LPYQKVELYTQKRRCGLCLNNTNIRSPQEPGESIVKRIIGLEGDYIHHRNTQAVIVIPKGYCWLEGDNSNFSVDSNKYGAVPLGLIQGKAVRVLIPQEKWTTWSRFFLGVRSVDFSYRRTTSDDYWTFKNTKLTQKALKMTERAEQDLHKKGTELQLLLHQLRVTPQTNEKIISNINDINISNDHTLQFYLMNIISFNSHQLQLQMRERCTDPNNYSTSSKRSTESN